MTTLQLLQSIIVGGTATAFATQILKSDLVSFVPSEKYPRITAFVVSAIASVVAIMQSGFNPSDLHDWTDWVALVCGTLMISAATYKALIKGADPKTSL